jgi:hypothetical protein
MDDGAPVGFIHRPYEVIKKVETLSATTEAAALLYRRYSRVDRGAF